MDNIKDIILKALEDKKAQDIKIIDNINANLAECMIFVSGSSARNVAAIADHLIHVLKHNTPMNFEVEGLRNASWVLIEVAGIMVHIFHPETRNYYNLEQLYESNNK